MMRHAPPRDDELRTGERLYVHHARSEADRAAHLERYAFAVEQIPPGHVILDAACGSGYGSEMLAGSAKRVIGLDNNDHALAYARLHHSRTGVDFRSADLNQALALPDASMDTVVCFETLEHVRNQDLLLREFHRVLKPQGRLILSTPDREVYSGKAYSDNPFHVSELSKDELVALVSRDFEIDAIFGQAKYGTPVLRVARALAKLDKFGLRRLPLRRLGKSRAVSRSVLQSSIEKLEPGRANHQYFYLLLVATGR